MNSLISGGGSNTTTCLIPEWRGPSAKAAARGTVPASTVPYGSQSGGDPSAVSDVPAGCRLAYAHAEMMDGRAFDNEGYFND